ncbi:hypothetical protein L1049_024028 [Liquidambar formosana]|uniref:ESF1 RRM domain-containing protein n=1 Tax=Liquidambar formosana TaxID=63359 RepID=A0AAP0RVB5_LIQFO
MGSKTANVDKKKKKKSKSKREGDDPGGGAQDSNNHHGAKLITDARFASVHSDPRFQKVTKHKSKVAIDSRFDRMFSDKSFATSSAPLDKRGKPKKKSSENPLRHYYRLEEEIKEEEQKNDEFRSDEDEDDDEEEEEDSEKRELKELGSVSSDSEYSDESERSEDDLESDGSQSTSDTDEEDDYNDGDVYLDEDEPSVQEESIPVIEKETHRLAVVNMDWGEVKAVDLYVVLRSFLPKGGQILSVAVYPSEFGLKRMEEEAVHGPIGLFDDEEGQDDEDGDDEIDNEKLRAYEKSKLRYYYAVVDCDSSATADYLYKACDGVEFERSSNKLDLRFIPDSMEFKHPPRDVATQAPSDYDGLDFHTRALQHSNIHLSWDEDEPHRAKTLKRKFNADQLAELELKEFLASDESETDDDENNDATEDQSDKKHNKQDIYRALIQSGGGSDEEGEDDGQDMEVTFNTGLEDISKRILEKKDKKSETVWEAHLRKRSEKKKARKNRSKYSSEDEGSDTDQEAIEQPDDFFVEEPSVKEARRLEVKVTGKKRSTKKWMGKQKPAERSLSYCLLMTREQIAILRDII